MRTKIFVFFIASMIFTGCGKENILWLEPGHEYTVSNILVMDVNNQVHDLKAELYWFADRITFTKKHPLGLGGEGVVKVIRDNYQTTDYTAYGAVYDYNCGCYYYDWYSYQVSWNNTQVNEYSFDWDKESQKSIELKFSKYDPIINGTGDNSFWDLLSTTYHVSKEDSKCFMCAAETIVLTSWDEKVTIILKR